MHSSSSTTTTPPAPTSKTTVLPSDEFGPGTHVRPVPLPPSNAQQQQRRQFIFQAPDVQWQYVPTDHAHPEFEQVIKEKDMVVATNAVTVCLAFQREQIPRNVADEEATTGAGADYRTPDDDSDSWNALQRHPAAMTSARQSGTPWVESETVLWSVTREDPYYHYKFVYPYGLQMVKSSLDRLSKQLELVTTADDVKWHADRTGRQILTFKVLQFPGYFFTRKMIIEYNGPAVPAVTVMNDDYLGELDTGIGAKRQRSGKHSSSHRPAKKHKSDTPAPASTGGLLGKVTSLFG